MNIIGLGRVGCNLAEQFSRFPQYKISKVDRGLQGEKRCLNLPDLDSPEEYEKLELKTGNFLRGLSGEVLVILSGASVVSGVSLRLLEQIHKKGANISLLYIEPEVELLGQTKRLQENIVRNVLQQYTRSGLFKKIFLVQNASLESMLGDVPILEYHDTLNSYLVNMIHLLNVFENSESVSDSFSPPPDTARICTFGVMGEDRVERLLYPMEEIREIRYYFGIPSESLRTQNSLYREIIDLVKSKISKKLRASYGIYETSYESPITYGIYYSSQIQEKS